jgi:hypothetical protein
LAGGFEIGHVGELLVVHIIREKIAVELKILVM